MELLLDTGLWAIVAGASFLLIVIFSAVGGVVESRLKSDPARHKKAGLVFISLMLALCIILALAMVPVMVNTVLGFQEMIGNRDIPAIAFVLDNRATIILAMWAVLILGSAIGIPAMLRDMNVS